MNQLKKICSVWLLLSLTAAGSVLAQITTKLSGQSFIDSLLKELPKRKEDTNKAKLLDKLSYSYWNINPDEGIKYGRQDSALAAKLAWKKGIGRSENNIGINYWGKSDFPEALVYYTAALKVFEENGDNTGVAAVFGDIGIVYDCQGDNDRALEYYFKALKMDEETGNKKGAVNVIGNIGVVYQNQSDYVKALEYYFKALKIDEEDGDKDGAAIVTGNIGNVYLYQNDYAKALEYYFDALKKHQETGDKNGVARVTGNIALVYQEQGDDDKALEYYFEALKAYEEIGDKNGVANNTRSIGDFYAGQHNYIQAMAYLFQALKISEGIGDKYDAAMCLGSIGGDYVRIVTDSVKPKRATTAGPYQRDSLPAGQVRLIPNGKAAILHKALEYLNKAIAVDREINSIQNLADNYRRLSTADSLLGDYEGSLKAITKFIIYKDSVFSKKNSVQIARLEYQKKIATDSVKSIQEKRENELKYKQQRNYTYLGVAVAFLLLGFSFFMLRHNKLLGKEKKRSEDLLLNILPVEVAGELKDKGTSAARYYDNVTVMFTDFVNFTQAGEKMSPETLIDELHTCFKTFDEITAKHGIEKIKTIGDAYLAVAGLPALDPNHAENIVKAAIEINNFMHVRYARLGDRTFEIRIGIHSGSVVAGIVGVKKFAYDIWGDTVNTAARMEQNSEPGKINISQTTYGLVKDKFVCAYRGEIDAKNKGKLKMYYVS